MHELSADWLARKKQATAESYYRTLETAYRVHVQPRWGTVSVADVDVLGVEAWITGMVPQRHRCHDSDSGARCSVGHPGRCGEGETAGSQSGQGCGESAAQDGQATVYLTADDVTRLADKSGEHRALVLVLAYCGVRWGEAIGLRVRDVEFLRRRISVSENAVQIGTRHVVGPTKGARIARCRCPNSS